MVRNKVILSILLILFVVFLFSGWVLADYWLDSRHQQQEHERLRQLVQISGQGEATPLMAVSDPQTGETRMVLREYAALYESNSDFVGWVTVPGTRIDYPVMQSTEKDYYLRRGFDRKRTNHGSIYAWEQANVAAPSDNVTLFGHRMNDGTMFYDLLNYDGEAFWREHTTFRFSTLEEKREYEIFAAFRTSGTGGEGFAYHAFVDAADAEEFDAFVHACKELSFYDTGITPQYGEKLVTLSTCNYAMENGRMVVVGRSIDP